MNQTLDGWNIDVLTDKYRFFYNFVDEVSLKTTTNIAGIYGTKNNETRLSDAYVRK